MRNFKFQFDLCNVLRINQCSTSLTNRSTYGVSVVETNGQKTTDDYSDYLFYFVFGVGVLVSNVDQKAVHREFFSLVVSTGPPLWSSGQSSWLQIQMSRVPFPTLRFSEK
jgi:hypothetical protein